MNSAADKSDDFITEWIKASRKGELDQHILKLICSNLTGVNNDSLNEDNLIKKLIELSDQQGEDHGGN